MVELEVHLHQSLLHVLDMGSRILDQPFSLAQISKQRCDLCVGPKAPAQQAIGMQLAKPRRIANVGLSARDVLCITRVDQDHFEAVLLQNLVSRYPVDAGRLHRHAGDTAGSEPGGKIMQIVGEGAE